MRLRGTKDRLVLIPRPMLITKMWCDARGRSDDLLVIVNSHYRTSNWIFICICSIVTHVRRDEFPISTQTRTHPTSVLNGQTICFRRDDHEIDWKVAQNQLEENEMNESNAVLYVWCTSQWLSWENEIYNSEWNSAHQMAFKSFRS